MKEEIHQEFGILIKTTLERLSLGVLGTLSQKNNPNNYCLRQEKMFYFMQSFVFIDVWDYWAKLVGHGVKNIGAKGRQAWSAECRTFDQRWTNYSWWFTRPVFMTLFYKRWRSAYINNFSTIFINHSIFITLQSGTSSSRIAVIESISIGLRPSSNDPFEEK